MFFLRLIYDMHNCRHASPPFGLFPEASWDIVWTAETWERFIELSSKMHEQVTMVLFYPREVEGVVSAAVAKYFSSSLFTVWIKSNETRKGGQSPCVNFERVVIAQHHPKLNLKELVILMSTCNKTMCVIIIIFHHVHFMSFSPSPKFAIVTLSL